MNTNITFSQSDFESDLIQRKLSQVACEIKVQIPWLMFERYAAAMQRELKAKGVVFSIQELIGNQTVMESFVQACMANTNDQVCNALEQHYAWKVRLDAESLFAKEINEQKVIRNAKKAEANKKRKETLAVQAQKVEQQNLVLKEMGNVIQVSSENVTKAKAILKAAGLLEGNI